jgi:opacity protein-like surface antigen
MKPLYTFASTTLLACLFVSATPVLAQTEARGMYATVYAQASRLGSPAFDEIGNAGFGPGLIANLSTGIGLGGDIGFRYGNGWAAEFEWNWRRHGLKSLRKGNSVLVTDGDFASNVFFLNGLRRFAGASSGWTPYTGIGIGWVQEIDFDLNVGATERAWSKQGKVGLQLIGGAEIELGKTWRLTTDVRMLRLGHVELPAEEGVSGRLSRPRYNPVSVQVGLRRMF